MLYGVVLISTWTHGYKLSRTPLLWAVKHIKTKRIIPALHYSTFRFFHQKMYALRAFKFIIEFYRNICRKFKNSIKAQLFLGAKQKSNKTSGDSFFARIFWWCSHSIWITFRTTEPSNVHCFTEKNITYNWIEFSQWVNVTRTISTLSKIRLTVVGWSRKDIKIALDTNSVKSGWWQWRVYHAIYSRFHMIEKNV